MKYLSYMATMDCFDEYDYLISYLLASLNTINCIACNCVYQVVNTIHIKAIALHERSK